jgi:3-deoxy-manno-octulosonate cytidylyltransferase (CMP-KDO synthetase)
MGPSRGGTAVIIPARLLSTRFPGKLLHEVAGRSLLEWSYRRARAATGPCGVWIATDSPEIAQVASRFGASVVHTGEHASGSDRVAAAATQLWPQPQAVINLQADEPLIDPALITRVCAALENPDTVSPEIVTGGARFQSEQDWRDPGVVKVVCTTEGRALYFSRAPIPFSRDDALQMQFRSVQNHVLSHIGLYGYPFDLLQRIVAAPRSALERLESLEQMRALEMGIPIRVIEFAAAVGGVDTPADLERVRPLLERERERAMAAGQHEAAAGQHEAAAGQREAAGGQHQAAGGE